MPEKSELERTVEQALRGVPELRPQERRKWLGQFRERVILGLRQNQLQKPGAIIVVKEALKDPQAEILIVNNNISIEISGRYMGLAKEMNKEYRALATSHKEAMGLVVASSKAVNREEVELEVEGFPERFLDLAHKGLCKECYEELEGIDPDMVKDYRKITFFDRLIGLGCAACQKDINIGK